VNVWTALANAVAYATMMVLFVVGVLGMLGSVTADWPEDCGWFDRVTAFTLSSVIFLIAVLILLSI